MADMVDLTLPSGGSISAPIGDALDEVSAIWRESRDDGAASRLLVMSTEYTRYFRPLPRRGPMFERVVERGCERLLGLLLRSLTRTREDIAVSRLGIVVAAWGADPRVRAWLEELAARSQPPYRLGGDFHVALSEAKSSSDAMVEALPRARPLTEADRRALGRADDVIASFSRRRTALGLLRDVYRRPEDEGQRLVLADALLDLGDPWGELITLQSRRAPESSARAAREDREKELIRAHGATWLGRALPWIVGVDEVVFEGGLLSRAVISAIARTVGVMEWSTLRSILPPKRGSWPIPLMTTSMLSRAPLLEAASLRLVASSRPPRLRRHANLRQLTLSLSQSATINRTAMLAALGEREVAPNVERVDFDDYGLASTQERLDALLEVAARIAPRAKVIGVNDALVNVVTRLARRLSEGTPFPRIEAKVHRSSIAFDADARAVVLTIGTAVDLRAIGERLRDAKIRALRVDVDASSWDAFQRLEWREAVQGINVVLARV